ncbi:MAG: LysM peptidoglycan-binding domain-containing protein [Nitrospirae bacterium]|nr:LysM peptidoglycan-binding domain-containing protein [Nitrospirota bacterium]
MLNKKLILLFEIVLLSITSFALAQEQEIKEYKVQQGDTLWDISQKELIDPFLWPKVWKENPDIPNPDRIMPGQIIKIPLYLLRKEAQKEEPVMAPIVEAEPPKAAPAPIPVPAPPAPKPLVNANLYISSGEIAGTVNEQGKVIGSPSGKILLGDHDMVFVTTKAPHNPGDRFYTLRKGPIVRHPVTNNILGYLVEITGIAEIKKSEYDGQTPAQIIESYSDVNIGDILVAYQKEAPPVVSEVECRTPKVSGYVVEARQRRVNNGQFDIVYLDKGKKDDIKVGDLLKTANKGKFTVTNGLIQVIKVQDSTSVAIVRQSTDAISRGNLITEAEKKGKFSFCSNR